jgi:hypothetical protein
MGRTEVGYHTAREALIAATATVPDGATVTLTDGTRLTRAAQVVHVEYADGRRTSFCEGGCWTGRPEHAARRG